MFDSFTVAEDACLKIAHNVGIKNICIDDVAKETAVFFKKTDQYSVQRGYYRNGRNGYAPHLYIFYEPDLSESEVVDFVSNTMITMKKATEEKYGSDILFNFLNVQMLDNKTLCCRIWFVHKDNTQGLHFAPHSFLMFNPISIQNPDVDKEFIKDSLENFTDRSKYFIMGKKTRYYWSVIRSAFLLVLFYKRRLREFYKPGNRGAKMMEEDFLLEQNKRIN